MRTAVVRVDDSAEATLRDDIIDLRKVWEYLRLFGEFDDPALRKKLMDTIERAQSLMQSICDQ